MKTSLVSGFSSGSFYPAGPTPVKYKATDSAGNEATCTFTVTVMQPGAPGSVSLSCPPDISKDVSIGQATAVVVYPAVVASDGTSPLLVSGKRSGDAFPLGNTTVTFASHSGGSECSFVVTVTDQAPAEFTICPLSMVRSLASNDDAFVQVNYSLPVAVDSKGNNLQVTLVAGLKRGSYFPKGVTTVKYSVTDGYGQTSHCAFEVSVVPPGAAPTLSCPGDITRAVASGVTQTTVNYQFPVASDKSSPILRDGILPGGMFPLGITTVVFDTTSRASCSFTVSIHGGGTELVCPTNLNRGLVSTTSTSVEVEYPTPKMTSGRTDVDFFLRKGPVSKSEFPLGSTEVQFEAVEKTTGNSLGLCSFNVTVSLAGNCPLSFTKIVGDAVAYT